MARSRNGWVGTDERPQIVNERKRIGDRESDTVEGRKGSGFIATHVDRKARYTAAVKQEDKSAETVTRAARKAMKTPPAEHEYLFYLCK